MTVTLVTQNATLASAIRAAGLDSLDGAFAFEGGTDLDKPGLGPRRRTHLVLTDDEGAEHSLFLKRYNDAPLAIRLQGRLAGIGPGSQAWQEQRNIAWVSAAGVATMQTLAWGQEGRRSYILVSSVPGEAIERCGDAVFVRFGADMQFCESFTMELAQMVSRLHRSGLFHRDLYAAHLFLDILVDQPRLYLIDLARVIRPPVRRRRWQVKDLAQLKYSMPHRWLARYWAVFLELYLGGKANRLALEKAINRKVRRMARHDRRRGRAAEPPA